ncbi:TonB-dependent siderophore receptor [Pseudomonas sp. TH05]|uniref:TonB-dependent receptor n=1 Tax=unclassified Pseudomonas TaxID=196821 RepID=UPI00191212E4|nr:MULTISPECIES: TonB-dependent siderophore receptor [unclassified Pseudomonas]MBK5539586.1 TonB-dependent siderophore receptor [Pseudomonas sp. TH07]MBK5554871.1 TonB-dependent siderophore receptor [Pseudomonas sp. TH05]
MSKQTRSQTWRLWSTSLGLMAASQVGVAAEANESISGKKRSSPALTLEATDVVGEHREGYKRDSASSPKFTAPLRETPRSITIITESLMQDRAVTSLADALRTTPGITFGAGEGGTPLGDRPFIRGYEASTDIMIDGIRDVGRMTHEVFNIEQVEILKGPGSAYSGRGSTGGSINLVSKTAQQEDFIAGSLKLGTDQLRRSTLDINQYLPEQNMALRLNAMKHEADTPGRDHVEVSRWGIAPTFSFGLNTDTRGTLSYYHMQSDDMPDLGHPFSPSRNKPAKVDRDNFYGFTGRDFRKTSSDQGSLQLEHDFNEHLTLRNTTRGGRGMQDYIMTRPFIDTPAQEQSNQVMLASRARNVVNTSLINQTDVFGKFQTGAIGHSYSAGVEFSRERIDNMARYGSVRNPDKGNLADPDTHARYTPVPAGDGSHTVVKHNNRALYAMDTLALHEQWDLNLGLRYDNYHARNATQSNRANLWSYQAGLVFKPVHYASIYLSYGTSFNPSGETAGQSGGADGPAGGGLKAQNLDPEKSRSLELGTKWDLLDEKLSLTAAVFKTEKTNARSYDPVTGEVALTGNNEVQGFEVGATGHLSERWEVMAGYTYLDAKTTRYADSTANFDGNRSKFIAPNSASLWSTYMLTERWKVGGGATYMDKRYVDDANLKSLDAYWRYDAMVAYRVNKNLDLQFNVLNLTDETLYDASHVGIFATVAPGRSAEMTANLRF